MITALPVADGSSEAGQSTSAAARGAVARFRPPDEAVVTGIGRTGRLVTSAALILFLAMAALASAPITFLKVFATGIGAGILLDATVVRSLLVPALVSLFGQWNWWMPAWAAKVLRLPSPPGDSEIARPVTRTGSRS